MIKLLDLTNPRHQEIVAEEIARAKRILKEAASDRLLSWKQFLQSAARNLAAQMQGKAASETTLMNRLNRMPLANRLTKSDLDKIVGYAMKEMGLDVAAAARELDYAKIVKWIEGNLSKLTSYSYTSGGVTKTADDLVKWLRSGRASQSYLKGLIDDMDKLEGVAIDDADFYKDTETTGLGDISAKTNPRDMGYSLD
jgi:hypothetical protein